MTDKIFPGVDEETNRLLKNLGKCWQGDLAMVNEVFDEDLMDYTHWKGSSRGREGIIDKIKTIRTAFPDLKTEVMETMQRGNTIACRAQMTGTHLGAYGPIPPSGNKCTWMVNAFYETKDGKIAREWSIAQEAVLLMQMGVNLGSPPVEKK